MLAPLQDSLRGCGDQPDNVAEAPELPVDYQSFLVFKLETAASSHKNTMF